MVGPEAMCSGIPVVASPTPGLRESLGDAGIFVDTSNLNAWFEAVRALQDPSAWQEASLKALSRAEQLAAQDDTVEFVRALEGLV
jgi:glycosyltransferase involved in cell wall biosynthesis